MLGSVLIAGLSFSQQASAPKVGAEIVLPYRTVVAGDEFPVGIRLTVEERWHIYWMNPGDTGIPTNIKWTLPEGWQVNRLTYPTPHRYDDEGMVSYTHEGQVDFVAWITAPEQLKLGGGFDIKADVNWLACIQSCVPGSATVSGRVTVGSNVVRDPKAMEKLDAMRSSLPKVWQGETVVRREAEGDLDATFSGVAAREGFFFAESAEVVEPGALQPVATGVANGIGLRLKKSPYARTVAKRLRGVLWLKDSSGVERSFWIDAPIREANDGEQKRQ